MRWTINKLQELIKEYNKTYFNNEIKLPIMVKFVKPNPINNSKKDRFAEEFTFNNKHYININTEQSSTSVDSMQNTLIHEMIHCMQDEYDDTWNDTFKEDRGHNKYFYDMCDKLNNNFNFKFKLDYKTSHEEFEEFKNNNTGMYYVYDILDYTDGPMKYGVFVKFLHNKEIKNLKAHNLYVEYFDKVIGSETCKYKCYKNTIIKPKMYATTIPYYRIRNIIGGNNDIDEQLDDLDLKLISYQGDWFNSNDGIVCESELFSSINLLLEHGYILNRFTE